MYLGDPYVDDQWLHRDFLNIHAKMTALGLKYVFLNQG